MKLQLNSHFFYELFQYFVIFTVIFVSAIWIREVQSVLNKFFIIVADGILYVAWGIWHHHFKGRLTKEVVIEYGLVSTVIIFICALAFGIIRFF